MTSNRLDKGVQRYGMVIGIKPDKIEEYKQLHVNAWPGVLKTIRESSIRNYSIYFKEVEKGKYYLFSYFEYTGEDFKSDMEKMAADPVTQEWWEHCIPCVTPIPNCGEDELWTSMEEVFYTD